MSRLLELGAALLHGVKVLLAGSHVAARVAHAVGKGLGLVRAGRVLCDELLGRLRGLGGLGARRAQNGVHGAVAEGRTGSESNTCTNESKNKIHRTSDVKRKTRDARRKPIPPQTTRAQAQQFPRVSRPRFELMPDPRAGSRREHHPT